MKTSESKTIALLLTTILLLCTLSLNVGLVWAEGTSYVCDTSSNTGNNGSPWSYGFLTVGTQQFTPSAVTSYAEYIDSGWRGSKTGQNIFDRGAIAVKSGNWCFVSSDYEPVLLFTAPQSGAVSIKWGINAPARKDESLTDDDWDGIRYKIDHYSGDGTTLRSSVYPKSSGWRDLDRGTVLDEHTAYTYVEAGDKIQLRVNCMTTSWGDTFKIPQFTISYTDNVVFEKATEYLSYYTQAKYTELNKVNLSALVLGYSASTLEYASSNTALLEPVTNESGTDITGEFIVKGQTAMDPGDRGSAVKVTCKIKNAQGVEEKEISKDVYIMNNDAGADEVNYAWKKTADSASDQGWAQGPVWYYGISMPRGHGASEVTYGYDYWNLFYMNTFLCYRLSNDSNDYSTLRYDAPLNKGNLTNGGDTVISFKAPKAGTVRVSSVVEPKAYGNDGMRFAIRKGGQKVYPNDTEWVQLSQNQTAEVTPFILSVTEGDYIHFVVNINANNYSDVYDWVPKVEYVDAISFKQSKYLLSYYTDADEAAEFGKNNVVELNATVLDGFIDEVVYKTSDSNVMEWIGGSQFRIKGAASSTPITLTAKTKNGSASVSVPVYIYNQQVRASNNPGSYPLWTGNTAPVQGPVWYVKSAYPSGSNDLTQVTYTDLKPDIEADGKAIIWGGSESDRYTYGFSMKDNAGSGHTGTNADITFAFKVPKDGYVHVGHLKAFVSGNKPAGFKYRISNGQNVIFPSGGGWETYKYSETNGVPDSDNTAFYSGVDTYVTKDSFLYITINNNGTNDNSGFRYIPSVTYYVNDPSFNPYNISTYTNLAFHNVSADGGVSNNDVLQHAVSLGMASISITDNGTVSDGRYLADASDYYTPGEFKPVPANSDTANIDIELNDQYTGGRSLKDLDLIMKECPSSNSGVFYNLEFFYSTTDNPDGFIKFYALGSSVKPICEAFSVIRMSGFGDKITNVRKIRIKSQQLYGSAMQISEIDMNMNEDGQEIATKKSAVSNKLRVSGAYNDNMIFQQNKPICVTGWGGTGYVTVVLRKTGEETPVRQVNVAGSSMGWKAEMEALPGGFDTYTLTVSNGSDVKTFSNIMIGELWLASGQSNMAFFECETSTRDADVAAAVNAKIRFFKQDQINAADKRDDVMNGRWIIAEGANIDQVSAVGYHFAKKLYELLNQTVPIGILQVAVGGTSLQSFVPQEFLQNGNSAYKALDDSTTENPYENSDALPKYLLRATATYNGMLHPIRNMNIGGAIWYQGEANTDNPELYKQLQPDFIALLRSEFRDANLPFIITQLPSYGLGVNWVQFREVQFQNSLSTENTGMAVTIDTGERSNIHPTDKTQVGHRLALTAAGKFFGKSIEYSGPVYQSMEQSGNKLIIHFTHSEGLKTSSGKQVYNFEISADGKAFTAASASISGDTVEVSGIENPIAVRYCMSPYPDPRPNLYNGTDLPAVPFRAQLPEKYGQWNIVQKADTVEVSQTITNKSDIMRNEKLFVGVYNDRHELINVVMMPVAIPLFDTQTITAVSNIRGGNCVKVFQWDGMKPKIENAVYSLSAK